MDNNQNQQGQQLQIDLNPEIAKGIYTKRILFVTNKSLGKFRCLTNSQKQQRPLVR